MQERTRRHWGCFAPAILGMVAACACAFWTFQILVSQEWAILITATVIAAFMLAILAFAAMFMVARVMAKELLWVCPSCGSFFRRMR